MDQRYLSADIDPATDAQIRALKQRLLDLLHRELPGDGKLLNEARQAMTRIYRGMQAGELLHQLRVFHRVLNAVEEGGAHREAAGLMTALLRMEIYKVSGAALDAITLQRHAVQIEIDGRSTLIGMINQDLGTILAAGKETRARERRLRAAEKVVAAADEATLGAVARAFDMTARDTKQLVQVSKTLFDNRGRFSRRAFDAASGNLVRYGDPAFQLLWCFTAALDGRADRTALVNALQQLIFRSGSSHQALRYLLADFCRHAEEVRFADRNAIMLANILLRTYNKESDVDIEMTPESVLDVHHGLDRKIAGDVQFRLDSLESRFAGKVRIIHERLTHGLTAPAGAGSAVSVRHLLLLEREVFIFLALLSGRTAHRVLVSALNEYGHPNAGIYRHPRASGHLPRLLQQLKILARCFGRIGSSRDIELLDRIGRYGRDLAEVFGTREFQPALIRTRQWIDLTRRRLAAADTIPD